MSEGLNPFEPPKADPGPAVRPRLWYERFDWVADSSPLEVLADLSRAIEPVRWARSIRTEQKAPFEGTIAGTSFDCRLLLGSTGQAGSVRVRGTVVRLPSGSSRIRGSISFPLGNLFVVALIGGVVLIFMDRGYSHFGAWRFAVPLVAVAVVWIFLFSFWREAREARALLCARLRARPVTRYDLNLE
ncbi:MAG TPA: hypothetical protein VF103_17030 [Polyangiaceae bacterium]